MSTKIELITFDFWPNGQFYDRIAASLILIEMQKWFSSIAMEVIALL